MRPCDRAVWVEIAGPMALYSCTRHGAHDVELLRFQDMLWTHADRSAWARLYSPQHHFLHPVKGIPNHAVRWMRASRSARLRLDAQRQWERQLIARAATANVTDPTAAAVCPVPLPRVFRRHWDDTALTR